jgi:hypothetical protein
MAQGVGPVLDNGAPFPDLTWHWLDAGPKSLSAMTGGGWAVLLLYRGDW